MTLSDGVCHYRIDGPDDGPVLLLIHGATVPAWEFDRIVPYLTAAGLRCVRPDLFGHGFSDRPPLAHEYELFVRQLSELLDRLELNGPVALLGHSLGAAVAARLLAAQPARFAAAVLAAPLVDFTVQNPMARLLNVPLLGELLMPAYVVPMLVRRRTRRYRAIEDGRFVGKFHSQLRKPGFGRALLSLIRSGSLGDQSHCYRALDGHHHPLLVLRGQDDPIVSSGQVSTIRDLAPRASVLEIPGTAHAFLLTHPELVAPAVIDFLKR